MDENNLYFYLTLLLAVGLISLLGQIYVVFFLSIILSLFIFFIRYWTEHIFDNLVLKRNFSQEKIFPGDKLFLEIELNNKKLLPVIWLKLSSRISYDIFFEDQKYSREMLGKRKMYWDLFSINPFQSVKRKYPITVSKRGLKSSYMYIMTYTDPLGFKKEYHNREGINLIVFPRVLPLASPLPEFTMLFGSRRKEGWIFQDKLNRTGVRRYRPTDSFRQINWKASARSLELKSDIYKPSLDGEVHLFHGLWKKKKNWDEKSVNQLELSLITAASICNKYLQSSFNLSFYSNMKTRYALQKNYLSIHVKANKNQRDLLYTAMALLKEKSLYELDDIINLELSNIEPGATVIIIIEFLDEDLIKKINLLKKMNVVIIITIGKSKVKINGVKQYYINDKEAWNEIQKIELYH